MLLCRPPPEHRLPQFDLRDQLQRSLGSSYSIIRELGGGGMSRVFLAQELALGREVVLKVLPPELGGSLSPERFQREVRVAAGLQHPHIVPLFAAGEAEGILYYTMPFVAGESLRAKIDREGPLPVADTIRYLRDVVDALVAAHGPGIVHRDIKPDNVLITHQHAVVTDFGIAKALADAAGAEKMTATGLTLGTPTYMAPEQATGESHVDHRADLYAVGILGYEMLAGEPPFRGPSAQAVIAAHLARTPPSLLDVRPTVPPALAAIIARCLEKLPADRISSAAELLAAIDALAGSAKGVAERPTVSRATLPRVGVLFACAAAVILAVAYLLVRLLGLPDWVFVAAAALLAVGLPIILATSHSEERRTGRGIAAPPGESPVQRLLTWRRALTGGGLAFAGLTVATVLFIGLRTLGVGPFATLLTAGTLAPRDPLLVADFDNRTTDSTLGPAVTEALRIDLSRSHAVRLLETSEVTAALQRMERNPAQPFTSVVAREVAERAGAKAVVTGEIAPLGTGFTLSVRLVGSANGVTLLAERETASSTAGLIAAVDRLSRKLREGIGESLRIIRAGPPLEQVTTSSLEALRKYSDGDRAFDLGDGPRARAMMEAAIALDPNFAMAHRKLSVLLSNVAAERTLAVAEARRAFELRDRLPERERLHAIAFYQIALRGRPDSVIATYRQLLETWPEDKIAVNNLVLALNVTQRFAEAEETGLRGIAVMPAVFALYSNTLVALLAQNKGARADSVFARWGAAIPQSGFRLGYGAVLATGKGDYPMAERYLDSMIARGVPGGVRAAHRMRANVLRTQGRLAEAARVDTAGIALYLAAADLIGAFKLATDLAYDQKLFRGRPDAAVGQVDSFLEAHPLDKAPPADRPYLVLADFYARVGKPERAALFVAEYDRLVDPEIRKGDTQRIFAAGQLSMARGNAGEALAQFRRSRESNGECRTCAMFEIGEAFEGMQQADSALAAYESLVEWMPWDTGEKQFTLAPALRRIGELYEAKGNRVKALEYYGRMVQLWKNADPELQLVVQDVKKRMAAPGPEQVRP
ncbi:MAG TPA: protein kinase [Gemmatimonadaceae bacterium]|nr:protein kinase [Gemmatimonadaceae bacterium]